MVVGCQPAVQPNSAVALETLPEPATQPTAEELRQLRLRLQACYEEMNVDNFSLAGEVVDEQGKPLKDVTMVVAEYSPIPVMVQLATLSVMSNSKLVSLMEAPYYRRKETKINHLFPFDPSGRNILGSRSARRAIGIRWYDLVEKKSG